ncbi:MAG: tyrosine-type recombinase/integrase [Nitrospiraceae bacterium]
MARRTTPQRLGATTGTSRLHHTLKNLLAYYDTEYLSHKAPSTQKQQRGIHQIINQTLGPVHLKDLNPELLRAWRDTIAATHAPGTVRRYYSALAAPLRVAIEDLEWLSENPLRKVRKPAESPGRTRYLSPEERERLLEACQQSGSPHLYTIVCVALSTGARRGEILGLTWPLVDFQQQQIRIGRSKNGDRRSVPLVGLGLEALKAHRAKYPKATGLLFPCATGHRPMFVQHPFETARRRAGLEDFHFHDLRHTFASYMAMSGASLLELAALLGHRDLDMVQRYAHLTNSHLNGIVAKMNQSFLGEERGTR